MSTVKKEWDAETRKNSDKAELIVEASDYELCLGCAEDEEYIAAIIEDLESRGVAIAEANLDIISSYTEDYLAVYTSIPAQKQLVDELIANASENQSKDASDDLEQESIESGEFERE